MGNYWWIFMLVSAGVFLVTPQCGLILVGFILIFIGTLYFLVEYVYKRAEKAGLLKYVKVDDMNVKSIISGVLFIRDRVDTNSMKYEVQLIEAYNMLLMVLIICMVFFYDFDMVLGVLRNYISTVSPFGIINADSLVVGISVSIVGVVLYGIGFLLYSSYIKRLFDMLKVTENN